MPATVRQRGAVPSILLLNDEVRIAGPEKTGFVADGVAKGGGTTEWLDLARGAALPSSFAAYDGIVLTGGEMSVFDERNRDRVARLTDAYLSFDAARKPVLGLCLGAQIIARAHGAQVERMDRMQFGFEVLRPTEVARNDPVLARVSGPCRAFESHRDRFSLPRNAELVMIGEEEPNQVFRIGAAGYGFQCHFEATRELILEWMTFFDTDMASWLGDDPEGRKRAVLRDLDDAMPEAERFAKQVMTGWMGLFG